MENVKLLAAFDWSQTKLGPLENWPAGRRAVVETALGSSFPICLALGDDLVQIYNDGYNRILGEKHPGAFGAKAIESWGEIWEFLKPALDRVKLERQPLYFSDYLLPLKKTDHVEECYFSFSYSPAYAADGSVEGVMSVAVETTQVAIEKRRRSLMNFSVEAPFEGLHPISEGLRKILGDNELDAKAALVFNESLIENRVEWAMRCDLDLATMFSEIPLMSARRSYGVIPIDPCLHRAGHADFLGFVGFTAADGKSLKKLALWPSALITEDSLLDLLSKLEKRLQLATRHVVSFGSIRDELAQTDLVYQFLFENTLDGVVFTSPDLEGKGAETIIAANKAACDMLGYQIDEMIGMCRDDFFFAKDEQLASALAERAEQKVFNGELVFRHKSGRPVHLKITSILSNPLSGQRRSMSILRDWAQELNLERERAERSRLESIAQMTGGISHDFNNLLMVITSAAEFLNEHITEVDQKDAIGDILAASTRAANLTFQLLAYSKRQNLQPSTIDVNSAIQQIERLLQTVVGSDVHIRFSYSRRHLVAEIDTARLTTALVNLIKNAGDAIDGRGSITVSTRLLQNKKTLSSLSLQPGKYVTITVRDRGAGIAPKLLPRIFDPFFTTKSGQGGSGLGLSMVQGFARQSGGDVVVQSTLGAGTAATLYIPFGARLSETTSAEVFKGSTALSREGSVLIVDDDPLVRRQVTRIVKSLGMTAIEAAAADEAIDLLKSLPKIVLTDLAMPGERTGLDVVEACQRSVPPIPVIVMSGYASDPRWRTASLQEHPTVDKPFSRKSLVAAIAQALKLDPDSPAV